MTGGVATIVSLRAGRVRTHDRPEWDRQRHQRWRTAYYKDEVPGPMRATSLGLEADEQASSDSHGGVHMALLAYANAHYSRWRAEDAALAAMGPGGFGENLCVDGVEETGVCIGDLWEGANVRLEVSQPRGPCKAISRVWNAPDLMQRATDTGRVGWYLRVRREGELARGETLRLAERPNPEWSVARVFRAWIGVDRDPAALAAIAELDALSPEWRARARALVGSR
jgi:MOSC domain-containing protein YiiM